jgi:hypothetical protein
MSSKTSRFQVTQLFRGLVRAGDTPLDTNKFPEDGCRDCGGFLQGLGPLPG